jgi:hypothetical protein
MRYLRFFTAILLQIPSFWKMIMRTLMYGCKDRIRDSSVCIVTKQRNCDFIPGSDSSILLCLMNWGRYRKKWPRPSLTYCPRTFPENCRYSWKNLSKPRLQRTNLCYTSITTRFPLRMGCYLINIGFKISETNGRRFKQNAVFRVYHLFYQWNTTKEAQYFNTLV